MLSNDLRKRSLFGAAALASAVIAGCGSSSTSGDHASKHGKHGSSMPGMTHTAADHATHGMPSGMPGMTPLVKGADGTRASARGLTLKTDATAIRSGRKTLLALKVLDAQGMPVTKFDRDQTKLMHLIVVRDDFTGYQHIHPVLGSGGRFTVPLVLPAPGRYRAIADFTTARKRYALGVNITAPGRVAAAPLPPPSSTTTADGYDIQFDHGPLKPGGSAKLTFTVRRAGKPVRALQPYLGAFGHLVALRKPDLAYSHVHPVAHNAAGGTVTFDAEFASAATYRLFLQFRAAGRVHTAPFTVAVAK